MKSWKKVASMILAATMLTPFAACGDKGGDSSTPETLTNAQLAANYANAISKTMEETKSLKLTGAFSLKATEYYYADGTTTVDPSKTHVDQAQSVAFEAIISEDADGYALKLKATMEQTDVSGTMSMTGEAIVKGQYAYTRSYMGEAGGSWTKEDLGMALDVETIVETQLGVDWEVIEEMLGVKEIADATSAAKQALVNGFYNQLEAGAIKDNQVSFEINFAPFVSEWIEYINSVDESTMKFGAFVDATAAKAGIPFTYATFVDSLAALSEKTVAEAIDILDASMQEGAGMSLQEMKDALLATEIADVFFAKTGMDAETVAAIKAMTIADVKAQFADLTVHEMMNQIMASAQQGEAEPITDDTQADPWAETLQMLVAMKDVTLEQMEIALPTIPATANDLTLFGAIAFNQNGTAVTSVSFGADVELKVEFGAETGAAGTANQPGYGLAEISASFAMSEFSTSVVAVQAPAANEIAPDLE